MLIEVAEFVAPAATMIAASMTAANLGPRVTGWGFVVFTVGSLAWSAIAMVSGQHSLLLTNAFLTLVNGVGVWRWLGRLARFEAGANSAETKSQETDTPTLVNIGAIEGRTVVDRSGTKIGRTIGAMAAAKTGTVVYIVAGLGGVGGIGERLVAIPWNCLRLVDEEINVQMTEMAVAALPNLNPADWPDRPYVH